MLTLEKGRPTDESSREEREIRTYDFLDALNVEYERVDHDCAMTMEDCAEIDKVLNAMTCKNLFLCNRQETQFYLLMIPADKVFKTKFLSSQLGVARLSFANEGHMLELLDITPGSVSVMGLMNDKEYKVSLVIDRDVLSSEYIGLHPCKNTTSLRIKTDVLLEKVIPALKHSPTIVDLPTFSEQE